MTEIETLKKKVAELTAACIIKDELIAEGWRANERHQETKITWSIKKSRYERHIENLRNLVREIREYHMRFESWWSLALIRRESHESLYRAETERQISLCESNEKP